MKILKTYEELGRIPQIGDMVKIVDVPDGKYWEPSGLMNEYLSTYITVRHVMHTSLTNDWCVQVEGNSWCWHPHMIHGVIVDIPEEIDDDPSVWADGLTIDDLLTS